MSKKIEVAESIMRSTLRSLGYFRIEFYNINSNSFEITADGSYRNVIIFVVLEPPSTHIKLSNKISSKIKSLSQKANKEKRETWIANLEMESTGEPNNSIHWIKLKN